MIKRSLSQQSLDVIASIVLTLAILATPSSRAFAQSPAPTEPSSATPTPIAEHSPRPAPTADAAAANPLELEVVGLRSDSGEVGCSLFFGAQGFPRDDSKVIRHVWAPVHDRKALCRFGGLATGQYAAVVFHDENGDHEFNMNAFGMPKEGYGFSNDAAALFSPPEFQAAAFSYVAGRSLYLVINIRY
jgi:uncharacterized protein (DUF2141 family)